MPLKATRVNCSCSDFLNCLEHIQPLFYLSSERRAEMLNNLVKKRQKIHANMYVWLNESGLLKCMEQYFKEMKDVTFHNLWLMGLIHEAFLRTNLFSMTFRIHKFTNYTTDCLMSTYNLFYLFSLWLGTKYGLFLAILCICKWDHN